MDALRASLIAHEGKERKPYTCTAGDLTIGVGRNLTKPLSDAAIDFLLTEDISESIAELDRAQKGWRDHSDNVQNVLIEMQFNMGANRLASFRKMWLALKDRDYNRAADEMLNSLWANQVGKRAKTLAERMRRG
jgi:lysozyme